MTQKIRWMLKKLPLLCIPAVFFLRILRGYRAYKKVLLRCGGKEGSRLYFMDYEGSGDSYLCCACLNDRGQISDRDVFVASGPLPAKIAACFPFGKILTLPPAAAAAVRCMGRFSGVPLIPLPLLYESAPLAYSGILRKLQGYRGLDFLTMLRVGFEAHLGIPFDDSPWRPPALPHSSGALEEAFRKWGLLPGRTLLLAPYAGGGETWGIPMEFYVTLARSFMERGFAVCTNSADPVREPPVPGTLPLAPPYEWMVPFCERAGYFVGTRSGLCDILSSARCKKVILYPETPGEGVGSMRDFFSLEKMGLCGDAIEREYTPERGGELLREIERLGQTCRESCDMGTDS